MALKVNYLANVVKSLAFTAAEVGTEMAPDVSSFVKGSKDIIKETYSKIRVPSSNSRRRISGFMSSKVFQPIDIVWQGLKQDIKTGDFYGEARQQKQLSSAIGGSDFDFDNLDDFGVESEVENNDNLTGSGVITAGDMKIASSIEGAVSASAKTTMRAILASTDNNIRNMRANAAMAFDQNERHFGGLHTDLKATNNILLSMFNLQQKVGTNIDRNLSRYQTEHLRIAVENNNLLKQIVDMQKQMIPSTAASKENTSVIDDPNKAIRFSDLVSGAWFNPQMLVEHIKRNAEANLGMLSQFIPGTALFDMAIAPMLATPIKSLTKFAMGRMIPGSSRKAISDLNKTIGGLFANTMASINKRANKPGNSLIETIINNIIPGLLGVQTDYDKTIDTSRYEKGAVAWDGYSRKALTNVIPGYLRRIEAALTGGHEIDYDYDRGKWVRLSDVKAEYKDYERFQIEESTREIMEEMNSEFIKAQGKLREDLGQTVEEFKKAQEEFREYLFKNNGQISIRRDVNEDLYEFPLLDKYYDLLTEVYDTFDRDSRKKGRFTKSGTKMGLARNILLTKDDMEQYYRSLESNMTSSIAKLYEYTDKVKPVTGTGEAIGRGSSGGTNEIFRFKDKYGMGLYDYLHDIHKELVNMHGNVTQQLSHIGGQRVHTVTTTTGSIVAPVSAQDGLKHAIGHVASEIPGMARQIEQQLLTRAEREALRQEEERQHALNEAAQKSKREHEIRRKVLQKINSGKILDLRDFEDIDGDLMWSDTVRNYLLELSILSSEQLEEKYERESGSSGDFKKIEFENFIDKQFKRANITNDRQFMQALQDTKQGLKNNTFDSEFTNVSKSATQKVMAKMGLDKFGPVVEALSDKIDTTIYTADRWLYDIYFKKQIREDGTEYNGFLDFFIGKTGEAFKSLGAMIDKKVIQPMRQQLGLEGFKDRFKGGMLTAVKNFGNRVIEANKRIWFDPMVDYGMRYENVRGAMCTISPDMYRARVSQSSKDFFTTYLSASEQKAYRDELKAAAASRDSLKARMDVIGFKGSVANKIRKLKSYGVKNEIINSTLARCKTEEEKDHALNMLYQQVDVERHADGTMYSTPFTGRTLLSKGEMLFGQGRMHEVKQTGLYDITQPKHIMSAQDSYDYAKAAGIPHHAPRTSVAASRADEDRFEKKLLGSMTHMASGTISMSKLAKSDIIGAGIDAFKQHAPEVLGTSAVAGITYGLLGLPGGVLTGAALAAGASLLHKSNRLQDILLGRMDSDGKRIGGLISLRVQNLIKKYAPDMVDYGLVGLTGSLILPFGPITGLAIGAGLGLLKNNQDLRERIFGKVKLDASGKEIIKKMLPPTLIGAGAGAIATLFGGPFGLMGNALLGSALGMMATTDEFKKLMFGDGDSRSGGIIGAIKNAFLPLERAGRELSDRVFHALQDNIINPLKDFAIPFIHALPRIAAWLPKKVDEWLSHGFGVGLDTVFERVLVNPIKALFRPIARWSGRLFRFATYPMRIFGWAGNKIRESQLRNLDAGYMGTAADRLAWRTARGETIDARTDLDSYLAGISGVDARDMRDILGEIIDSRENLNRQRKRMNSQILNKIKAFRTASGAKISAKTIMRIGKAINENKLDNIPQLLANLPLDGSDSGMTREQLNNLMLNEGLSKDIASFTDINRRYENALRYSDASRRSARRALQKRLKGTPLENIDLADNTYLERLRNYYDIEAKNKIKVDDKMMTQLEMTGSMTSDVAKIRSILEHLLYDTIDYEEGGTGYTRSLAREDTRTLRSSLASTSKALRKQGKRNIKALPRWMRRQLTDEDRAELEAFTKPSLLYRGSQGLVSGATGLAGGLLHGALGLTGTGVNLAGNIALSPLRLLGFKPTINIKDNMLWDAAHGIISGAEGLVSGTGSTLIDMGSGLTHLAGSAAHMVGVQGVGKTARTRARIPANIRDRFNLMRINPRIKFTRDAQEKVQGMSEIDYKYVSNFLKDPNINRFLTKKTITSEDLAYMSRLSLQDRQYISNVIANAFKNNTIKNYNSIQQIVASMQDPNNDTTFFRHAAGTFTHMARGSMRQMNKRQRRRQLAEVDADARRKSLTRLNKIARVAIPTASAGALGYVLYPEQTEEILSRGYNWIDSKTGGAITTFKNVAMDAWENPSKMTDAIVDAFTNEEDGIVTQISEKLDESWEYITKPFIRKGGIFDSIYDTWGNIKDAFIKEGGILDDIKAADEKAWGYITSNADSAWKSIVSPFTRKDGILDGMFRIWDNTKNAFVKEGGILDEIKAADERTWRYITDKADTTWGAIAAGGERMWNNIGKFAQDTWEGIIKENGLLDRTGNFAKGLWTSFKNVLSEEWGKFVNLFGGSTETKPVSETTDAASTYQGLSDVAKTGTAAGAAILASKFLPYPSIRPLDGGKEYIDYITSGLAYKTSDTIGKSLSWLIDWLPGGSSTETLQLTNMGTAPMIAASIAGSLAIKKVVDLVRDLYGKGVGEKEARVTEKVNGLFSKYGLTGALGGMAGTIVGNAIPGIGPLTGGLIGSALSMASQAKSVGNVLFGDLNPRREWGGNALGKVLRGLTFGSVGFGFLQGADTLGVGLGSLLSGMGLNEGIASNLGWYGNIVLGSGIALATGANRINELFFGKMNKDGTYEGTKAGARIARFALGALGGGKLGYEILNRFMGPDTGIMGTALAVLFGALAGGITTSSKQFAEAMVGKYDKRTKLSTGGLARFFRSRPVYDTSLKMPENMYERIANGDAPILNSLIKTKQVDRKTPRLGFFGSQAAGYGTFWLLDLLSSLIGLPSSYLRTGPTKLFSNILHRTGIDTNYIDNALTSLPGINHIGDIRKFAAYLSFVPGVGRVSGLLNNLGYFSTLPGMMLPSIAKFIHKSEAVQDVLFGKANYDTRGKSFGQNLLYKYMPKMIKMGGTATILSSLVSSGALGPLGFLGAPIVTAGLSLFASTDKFNDLLIGKPDAQGKRQGGVIGYIYENTLKPYEDVMTTMRNFMTNTLLIAGRQFKYAGEGISSWWGKFKANNAIYGGFWSRLYAGLNRGLEKMSPVVTKGIALGIPGLLFGMPLGSIIGGGSLGGLLSGMGIGGALGGTVGGLLGAWDKSDINAIKYSKFNRYKNIDNDKPRTRTEQWIHNIMTGVDTISKHVPVIGSLIKRAVGIFPWMSNTFGRLAGKLSDTTRLMIWSVTHPGKAISYAIKRFVDIPQFNKSFNTGGIPIAEFYKGLEKTHKNLSEKHLIEAFRKEGIATQAAQGNIDQLKVVREAINSLDQLSTRKKESDADIEGLINDLATQIMNTTNSDLGIGVYKKIKEYIKDPEKFRKDTEISGYEENSDDYNRKGSLNSEDYTRLINWATGYVDEDNNEKYKDLLDKYNSADKKSDEGKELRKELEQQMINIQVDADKTVGQNNRNMNATDRLQKQADVRNILLNGWDYLKNIAGDYYNSHNNPIVSEKVQELLRQFGYTVSEVNNNQEFFNRIMDSLVAVDKEGTTHATRMELILTANTKSVKTIESAVQSMVAHGITISDVTIGRLLYELTGKSMVEREKSRVAENIKRMEDRIKNEALKNYKNKNKNEITEDDLKRDYSLDRFIEDEYDKQIRLDRARFTDNGYISVNGRIINTENDFNEYAKSVRDEWKEANDRDKNNIRNRYTKRYDNEINRRFKIIDDAITNQKLRESHSTPIPGTKESDVISNILFLDKAKDQGTFRDLLNKVKGVVTDESKAKENVKTEQDRLIQMITDLRGQNYDDNKLLEILYTIAEERRNLPDNLLLSYLTSGRDEFINKAANLGIDRNQIVTIVEALNNEIPNMGKTFGIIDNTFAQNETPQILKDFETNFANEQKKITAKFKDKTKSTIDSKKGGFFVNLGKDAEFKEKEDKAITYLKDLIDIISSDETEDKINSKIVQKYENEINKNGNIDIKSLLDKNNDDVKSKIIKIYQSVGVDIKEVSKELLEYGNTIYNDYYPVFESAFYQLVNKKYDDIRNHLNGYKFERNRDINNFAGKVITDTLGANNSLTKDQNYWLRNYITSYVLHRRDINKNGMTLEDAKLPWLDKLLKTEFESMKKVDDNSSDGVAAIKNQLHKVLQAIADSSGPNAFNTNHKSFAELFTSDELKILKELGIDEETIARNPKGVENAIKKALKNIDNLGNNAKNIIAKNITKISTFEDLKNVLATNGLNSSNFREKDLIGYWKDAWNKKKTRDENNQSRVLHNLAKLPVEDPSIRLLRSIDITTKDILRTMDPNAEIVDIVNDPSSIAFKQAYNAQRLIKRTGEYRSRLQKITGTIDKASINMALKDMYGDEPTGGYSEEQKHKAIESLKSKGNNNYRFLMKDLYKDNAETTSISAVLKAMYGNEPANGYSNEQIRNAIEYLELKRDVYITMHPEKIKNTENMLNFTKNPEKFDTLEIHQANENIEKLTKEKDLLERWKKAGITQTRYNSAIKSLQKAATDNFITNDQYNQLLQGINRLASGSEIPFDKNGNIIIDDEKLINELVNVGILDRSYVDDINNSDYEKQHNVRNAILPHARVIANNREALQNIREAMRAFYFNLNRGDHDILEKEYNITDFEEFFEYMTRNKNSNNDLVDISEINNRLSQVEKEIKKKREEIKGIRANEATKANELTIRKAAKKVNDKTHGRDISSLEVLRNDNNVNLNILPDIGTYTQYIAESMFTLRTDIYTNISGKIDEIIKKDDSVLSKLTDITNNITYIAKRIDVITASIIPPHNAEGTGVIDVTPSKDQQSEDKRLVVHTDDGPLVYIQDIETGEVKEMPGSDTNAETHRRKEKRLKREAIWNATRDTGNKALAISAKTLSGVKNLLLNTLSPKSGWLSKILFGGWLLKTGVLPALWDNLIKPGIKWIFTDGIPAFGKWFMDDAVPAIVSGIGSVLSSAWDGIKWVGGKFADAWRWATGTTTNSYKIDSNDPDSFSGLTDANGNKLTNKQALEEFRNAKSDNRQPELFKGNQRIKINDDGTVSFETENSNRHLLTSAAYSALHTNATKGKNIALIGKGTVAVGGLITKLVKAVGSIAERLPLIGPFVTIANKIIGAFGWSLSKIAGLIGKALTYVFSGLGKKFGESALGRISKKALSGVARWASFGVLTAVDFTVGMDQAEALLNTSSATTLETLVCGVCNAVCEFFCISLIPGATEWVCRNVVSIVDEEGEKDRQLRQALLEREYNNYLKLGDGSESLSEYSKRTRSGTGKFWDMIINPLDTFSGKRTQEEIDIVKSTLTWAYTKNLSDEKFLKEYGDLFENYEFLFKRILNRSAKYYEVYLRLMAIEGVSVKSEERLTVDDYRKIAELMETTVKPAYDNNKETTSEDLKVKTYGSANVALEAPDVGYDAEVQYNIANDIATYLRNRNDKHKATLKGYMNKSLSRILNNNKGFDQLTGHKLTEENRALYKKIIDTGFQSLEKDEVSKVYKILSTIAQYYKGNEYEFQGALDRLREGDLAGLGKRSFIMPRYGMVGDGINQLASETDKRLEGLDEDERRLAIARPDLSKGQVIAMTRRYKAVMAQVNKANANQDIKSMVQRTDAQRAYYDNINKNNKELFDKQTKTIVEALTIPISDIVYKQSEIEKLLINDTIRRSELIIKQAEALNNKETTDAQKINSIGDLRKDYYKNSKPEPFPVKIEDISKESADKIKDNDDEKKKKEKEEDATNPISKLFKMIGSAISNIFSNLTATWFMPDDPRIIEKKYGADNNSKDKKKAIEKWEEWKNAHPEIAEQEMHKRYKPELKDYGTTKEEIARYNADLAEHYRLNGVTNVINKRNEIPGYTYKHLSGTESFDVSKANLKNIKKPSNSQIKVNTNNWIDFVAQSTKARYEQIKNNAIKLGQDGVQFIQELQKEGIVNFTKSEFDKITKIVKDAGKDSLYAALSLIDPQTRNAIANYANEFTESITSSQAFTYAGFLDFLGKQKETVSNTVPLSGDRTPQTGTGKFGRGFSKQIDPRIAGIRYNSGKDSVYQTIGDSGCGPAAAVNALEALRSSRYGRGVYDILGASQEMLPYKEADGGTPPQAMANYLNRRGANANVIQNKGDMLRNIKNGVPTILMGSDSNGASPDTPFAENPHYVTATGLDATGKAIVQDPQAPGDNYRYDLNHLIGKSSMAITTGAGKYGRRSRYGRGGILGTTGSDINATKSQIAISPNAVHIRNYLMNKGIPEDVAYGILGNIQQESHMEPRLTEYALLDEMRASGKDFGIDWSNPKNYTKDSISYTNAVDSGKISKEEFLTPSVGASAGQSKRGYGLVQFTSAGLKGGLYDNTVARGKSIGDLAVQLDTLLNQINGGGYKELSQLIYSKDTTLETAAEQFARKYERPADVDKKVIDRIELAKQIKSALTGLPVDSMPSQSTFGLASPQNGPNDAVTAQYKNGPQSAGEAYQQALASGGSPMNAIFSAISYAFQEAISNLFGIPRPTPTAPTPEGGPARQSGEAVPATTSPEATSAGIANIPTAEGGTGVILKPQDITKVTSRINSPFGYRIHPIHHTRKLHKGVDLLPIGLAREQRYGLPIRAAADGTITRIQQLGKRGYGNNVIIDHGNGYQTLYAHLNDVDGLSQGMQVKAGQYLMHEGNSGGSTGPHLHFEVRYKGQPIDPVTGLPQMARDLGLGGYQDTPPQPTDNIKMSDTEANLEKATSAPQQEGMGFAGRRYMPRYGMGTDSSQNMDERLEGLDEDERRLAIARPDLSKGQVIAMTRRYKAVMAQVNKANAKQQAAPTPAPSPVPESKPVSQAPAPTPAQTIAPIPTPTPASTTEDRLSGLAEDEKRLAIAHPEWSKAQVKAMARRGRTVMAQVNAAKAEGYDNPQEVIVKQQAAPTPAPSPMLEPVSTPATETPVAISTPVVKKRKKKRVAKKTSIKTQAPTVTPQNVAPVAVTTEELNNKVTPIPEQSISTETKTTPVEVSPDTSSTTTTDTQATKSDVNKKPSSILQSPLFTDIAQKTLGYVTNKTGISISDIGGLVDAIGGKSSSGDILNSAMNIAGNMIDRSTGSSIGSTLIPMVSNITNKTGISTSDIGGLVSSIGGMVGNKSLGSAMNMVGDMMSGSRSASMPTVSSANTDNKSNSILQSPAFANIAEQTLSHATNKTSMSKSDIGGLVSSMGSMIGDMSGNNTLGSMISMVGNLMGGSTGSSAIMPMISNIATGEKFNDASNIRQAVDTMNKNINNTQSSTTTASSSSQSATSGMPQGQTPTSQVASQANTATSGGEVLSQKTVDQIVTVLMEVAKNTDKLNIITQILQERLGVQVKASDINEASINANAAKNLGNSISTAASKYGKGKNQQRPLNIGKKLDSHNSKYDENTIEGMMRNDNDRGASVLQTLMAIASE